MLSSSNVIRKTTLERGKRPATRNRAAWSRTSTPSRLLLWPCLPTFQLHRPPWLENISGWSRIRDVGADLVAECHRLWYCLDLCSHSLEVLLFAGACNFVGLGLNTRRIEYHQCGGRELGYSWVYRVPQLTALDVLAAKLVKGACPVNLSQHNHHIYSLSHSTPRSLHRSIHVCNTSPRHLVRRQSAFHPRRRQRSATPGRVHPATFRVDLHWIVRSEYVDTNHRLSVCYE